MVHPSEGETSDYSLRIDGKLINFKEDFFGAFDLLIKSYVVFQVPVPAEIKDFFNFILAGVMDVGTCSPRAQKLIHQLTDYVADNAQELEAP